MDFDQMKKAIEDAGYRVMPPPNEKQELLDLSGLTIKQVSTKSGVSVPQVCQWSRGELELRAEQVDKIERALLDAVRERRTRIDALVSGKRDRKAVAV
jgi:transcriptional regulator with XRE-family HTH domain